MVDVWGDLLRPPHGTTPAAVKSNIKSEMRSFKSNETFISLLSVVSKLYSAVLNNRPLGYLEDERLLAREQNGF